MIWGGKGIIGLDIGSRYIKAVELKEHRDGGFQLERLGITTILPELIVDGSILDASRVVEAIKKLVSEANIKTRNATIGISGHSSVIIKRISLQQMTEEELNESIKFEAEQYIPFDIEDVNLDFQILEQRQDENQMDVLIVAAKKDKINEYVSVVKEAGLNPVIVDVDVFALENLYEINYEIDENENMAIINIGASTININILKGGFSVFTRDSSIGGNLLSEALQREFTISYDSAERLKYGESIEGISQEDADSVLMAAAEDIIGEISRSFEFFGSASNQGDDISEIVLSGGSALTKDFVPLLTERVGINTGIVDPFKNVHVPDTFDKAQLKKIEPIVAVATGLALRRVGDR